MEATKLNAKARRAEKRRGKQGPGRPRPPANTAAIARAVAAAMAMVPTPAWIDDIRAGAAFPPHGPRSCPMFRCVRCGRVFPFYYTQMRRRWRGTHGRWCDDCRNHVILARERLRRRQESGWEPESHARPDHGIVIYVTAEDVAATGTRLVESSLPPEDEASLLAEIAEHLKPAPRVSTAET